MCFPKDEKVFRYLSFLCYFISFFFTFVFFPKICGSFLDYSNNVMLLIYASVLCFWKEADLFQFFFSPSVMQIASKKERREKCWTPVN